MYEPKLEHRFASGPWKVGSIGRDPFGRPARGARSPADLVYLLAEIHADDGSMDGFKGAYAPEKAAALKAHEFDRVALGQRGMKYERLDQLVNEFLLGVR